MDVKRDTNSEFDIAHIMSALEYKEKICARFGENCYACPLGKLGVFDSLTCLDIDKLTKRLELIYRVVEL